LKEVVPVPIELLPPADTQERPGPHDRRGGTMGRDLGPVIVAVGLLVVLVGVLAWSGGLSWFGRLPGDIRIESENVRVYIPWVSMLLVSVVVSILMSLFHR
jgi:NAD/NADP transhydrogenase beta subunit